MRRISLLLAKIAALVALLVLALPADGYVEAPMSIGAIIAQSTNIVVMRVEKVDKERNLIIYRKVQDLKGQQPGDVIKHNIGKAGFHPREWQFIMEWAEPGKTAIFFHNGGASETFIHNYWYQAYPGGEWWNMSHAEPFLLRSYSGRPEKLIPALTSILAGQEVIVPCMIDGDKNALALRSAKVQRVKASLKIQDYNPKRDFVGWGGEDFRALAGMPAFAQYAGISRTDPGAIGVCGVDFDGDGKEDVCLWGTSRVVLLQNAGTSFNEVGLPVTGGARAATWADYNGDGKPDLFLATPSGPKLLTNLGGTFRDDSAGLPKEAYYNLTAATWIQADSDNRPDLLVANGFHGLRLYRNLGKNVVEPIQLGPWHYAGPFDNTAQRGFQRAYPPEKEVELKQEYEGKGGAKFGWKQAEFPDGQMNNLALFDDAGNNDAAIYLHRVITAALDVELPISLGSDDTLSVWLNGKRLLNENVYRPAAPDQNRLILKLKKGENRLLMKICQGNGDWAFYFQPQVPKAAIAPLFDDVTAQVGLTVPAATAKGDHLNVADVNGDGKPDFFFAANQGALFLQGDKGFRHAPECGLQFKAGKVAPVFADYDGDKLVDVYVPLASGGKLFRNLGGGKFADVTVQAVDLALPMGQVACATWTDFDKDGKLDLIVGCIRSPNRYFRNSGQGRFEDRSEWVGLHQKVFNTRGLAAFDLNKDGAPDLVLNNEGGESALLLGSPTRPALGLNK